VIVVFVGPSLGEAQVRACLAGTAMTVLPPAAQGDIYRAWRTRPKAIVVIDGYFHDVAAVWHKEILWALSQGTPVLGGASMGALRAAELEPFGMIGVGAVFEAFRDGRLVSDDEVALAHGDASTGYRNMSVPLVNIRATLDRAVAEGVVPPGTSADAVEVARRLHYTERSYAAMLDSLGERHDTTALRAWLATGRVDQKALDAECLLRSVADGVDAPVASVPWLFEHTAMWDELTRANGLRANDARDPSEDAVMSALTRDAGAFKEVATAALAHLLAGDVARRYGRALDADDLVGALTDLRYRRQLLQASEVEAWMADNDLSSEGLTHLLASEVHLDWAVRALSADLEPYVLNQLRASGEYTRLRSDCSGAAPRG
jgi:hypothetical protein